MFRGLPPAIRKRLIAGTSAARIILTAGLGVISGGMIALLCAPPWDALAFAITTATTTFAFWTISGRIVPPTR